MKDPPSDIPHIPRVAAPPMLVAQLILAASLATFIAISLAVLLGITQDFDRYLLFALRNAADLTRPIGPGWMLEFMRVSTAIGTLLTLTAIVLLGVAWFIFRGDGHSLRMLLLVGFGGFVFNMVLKLGIGRPRPDLVPMLSATDPWSYPSGHAMMTLAISLALAVLIGRSVKNKRIRGALIVGAVLLSTLVGFSRMYLGVHYPSDVAAGWMLGLAWASTCWLLGWRYPSRRIMHREKARPRLKGSSASGEREAPVEGR